MSTSDEVTLSFEWGGLRLAGSLHLPPAAGPHPAVVMAQGSGPADRDSGGYFGPIRRALIDRGVATFAFDKPGCGGSSGDWRNDALGDRADQLIAALELVRSHPTIAADQVGVWGHSQGGWLVQKLAGRGEPLAFAIASSAPTISVREQILYDCEQSIRNSGHGHQQMQDAVEFTRGLLQAAGEGIEFAAIERQLLDPARRQPWFDSLPTIYDAGEWHHTRRLIGEPHQPISDLERVTCPFLAVYGGHDVLLPPWRGAEDSGRALAAADSGDATVVVFPLGDHRIQAPGTGQFVDGYLGLLGDWTAERARSSPPTT